MGKRKRVWPSATRLRKASEIWEKLSRKQQEQAIARLEKGRREDKAGLSVLPAYEQVFPSGASASRLSDHVVSFLHSFTKQELRTLFQLRCSDEGVEVLGRALSRLAAMEATRVNARARPNLRRDLQDTHGIVQKAARCLKRLDRNRRRLNLHGNTVRCLEESAAQIAAELSSWEKRNGVRGVSPQTPFLVSLVAFIRDATGKSHYQELADLVSAAYRVAGSQRQRDAQSLTALWKRHHEMRRGWQSRLGIRPRPSRCGLVPLS